MEGGEFMFVILAHNWWTLLLRGILAVIFGVMCFVYPGLTIIVLAMLFGAYALVDGVFAVISAVSAPKGKPRWWVTLLEGIAGIVVGIIALVVPGLTALWLHYLIAAWAIITGIFEIVAAIRLRKEITGEWLLILIGAASVLFGVLIMLMPRAGALAVVWWIGAYSLIFGLLFIVLSFRLRKWTRRQAELRAT
jgi:uncharacterized membrane protein HdeD (DUF308 family)